MSDIMKLSKERLCKLINDQERQIIELRLENIRMKQAITGHVHTIRDLKKKLRKLIE